LLGFRHLGLGLRVEEGGCRLVRFRVQGSVLFTRACVQHLPITCVPVCVWCVYVCECARAHTHTHTCRMAYMACNKILHTHKHTHAHTHTHTHMHIYRSIYLSIYLSIYMIYIGIYIFDVCVCLCACVCMCVVCVCVCVCVCVQAHPVYKTSGSMFSADAKYCRDCGLSPYACVCVCVYACIWVGCTRPCRLRICILYTCVLFFCTLASKNTSCI